MHGPIPGMAFDHFLFDCITFLTAHPTEIIVIQLRWDGVPAECARPTDAETAQYTKTALQNSNDSIKIGTLEDMTNLTIQDLRRQKKRLLLFKEINVLSTYSDTSNATLNGDSIITSFEKTLTPSSTKNDPSSLINIQCQATASNIQEVVVYSVVTANVSNSCLMATKGICDSKTLPWIEKFGLERVGGSGKVVTVMNDFFDGYTAETVISLCRKRLGGGKV